MIGARQVAGSTISKGGDSSPSNWVIVGRRPSDPRFPGHSIRPFISQPILPESRLFYGYALSVITTILPSEKAVKKAANVLERISNAENACLD
jgi:hypothetical protein